MENFRLLAIKRMDRVPSAWIRELCGMTKGVDERFYENVLRWFGHIERTGNDRIAFCKSICGEVHGKSFGLLTTEEVD